MKAQITFRSGAQVTFDIERMSTSKEPLSGTLVAVDWTHPLSEQRPARCIYIKVEEIVAITTHYTPEDTDEVPPHPPA